MGDIAKPLRLGAFCMAGRHRRRFLPVHPLRSSCAVGGARGASAKASSVRTGSRGRAEATAARARKRRSPPSCRSDRRCRTLCLDNPASGLFFPPGSFFLRWRQNNFAAAPFRAARESVACICTKGYEDFIRYNRTMVSPGVSPGSCPPRIASAGQPVRPRGRRPFVTNRDSVP